MRVVGFIWVVWVHPCAPWGSSGSFRFPLRWCWVPHWVFMCSFGRGLGVDGVIWVRWVHFGASWWVFGSFGCVLGLISLNRARPWRRRVLIRVFIWARPGGRRVHSNSDNPRARTNEPNDIQAASENKPE